MQPHKSDRPALSLVLGILGLFLWLIPLLGLPITMAGLIQGIKAYKEETSRLALAGAIVSGLGLGATCLCLLWDVCSGTLVRQVLANRYLIR